MPNPFGLSPHFGSVNWGADRVRRLLDHEEREKRARRSLASTAPSDPEEPPRELEPEHPLGSTAWGAQQFRHLMDREDDAKLVLAAGVPRLQDTARTGDERDFYFFDDAISDLRTGQDDAYLDYIAAKGASSETVASQLPGRERGPADAYRHVLWAAEMTRRFGEQRAREMLELHEREGDILGQQVDERTMDANNNEIGIQVGIGARTYEDVIRAARKSISGSMPDGSGTWKPDYDTTSTMAPYAARWLSEDRWAKNPKFEVPRRYPFPALRPQEIPTQQTNWYANPNRSGGPDWDEGYVPDSYSYPYGGPQHATGPDDSAILRAEDAYRFLVDRPWAVQLKNKFRSR